MIWLQHIFEFPIYWTAFVLQRLLGDRREAKHGVWAERLVYARFWQGVPALVGLGLVLFVAAAGWLTSGNVERIYIERARLGFEQQQYDAAILSLHRLIGLRPGHASYVYQLARAYEGKQDLRQADGLMRTLAPVDESGFVPAQLWLVRRRLQQGKFTPDDLRDLEARLIRARDDPEHGREAAVMLADLYIRTNRIEYVLREPTLTRAAESVPELRLPLMQQRAGRERPEKVQAAAQELVVEFRRRLTERPNDVETRRRLAQSHLLAGDLAGAEVTVREGLTLGGEALGELLASIRLEQVRLATTRRLPPEAREALVRSALVTIEKYVPAGAGATLERARLHRLLNDLPRAEAEYRTASATLPLARLELAEFLTKIDRLTDAEAEYAAVVAWYEQLPATDRRATSQVLLSGPLAALRLKNFAQAAEWLEPSQPDETPVDAAARRTMLLLTYLAWSDSPALQTATDGASQRLQLLTKALKIAPYESAVLQRLLDMSQAKGTVGDEARRRFSDLIAAGDAPASAYLLAGTDALVRGDHDTGVRWLEQAQRLNPEFYEALNNLAWAVAFGPMPDLERALRIANAAVEKAPGDTRLRDTRGRILAKQQRWREALVDLELCAASMKNDAEYHRLIAQVYEKLGLSDVAQSHREQAETQTK